MRLQRLLLLLFPRRLLLRFIFSLSLVLSRSCAAAVAASFPPESSVSFDFFENGAIPDNNRPDICAHNAALLQRLLQGNVHPNLNNNNLNNNNNGGGSVNQSTIVVIIPVNRTFYLHHGVVASGLNRTVFQIDGTLRFERRNVSRNAMNTNPTALLLESSSMVPSTPYSILIQRSEHVTLTSSLSTLSSHGVLDGQGSQYWYREEEGSNSIRKTMTRPPHLIGFHRSRHVQVENLILQDAPSSGLVFSHVNQVQVRNVSIVTRNHNGKQTEDKKGEEDYRKSNKSSVRLLSWLREGTNSFTGGHAASGGGIDIRLGSHNVHVHDVDIWNPNGNCVTIYSGKSESTSSYETMDQVHDSAFSGMISNILVERVNASGLGFVITAAASTSSSSSSFNNGESNSSVVAVNNVTFRDAYLHKSVKGLTVQFQPTAMTGSDSAATPAAALGQESIPVEETVRGEIVISNIAFQNIFMESPTLWPLWFGPECQHHHFHEQQQSFSQQQPQQPTAGCNADIRHPTAYCVSALEEHDKNIDNHSSSNNNNNNNACHPVDNSTLRNMTLTNITIHNPHQSPGVLLGSEEHHAKIENVVFDHVLVLLQKNNKKDNDSNNMRGNSKQDARSRASNGAVVGVLHLYTQNLCETFPGLLHNNKCSMPRNSTSDASNTDRIDDGDGDDYDTEDETLVLATVHHYAFVYVCGCMLVFVLLSVLSPLLTMTTTANQTTTIRITNRGTNSQQSEQVAADTSITSNSGSECSESSSPILELRQETSAGGESSTSSSSSSLTLKEKNKRVRFDESALKKLTSIRSSVGSDAQHHQHLSLLVYEGDDGSDCGDIMDAAASLSAPLLETESSAGGTVPRRVATSFHWTYGHWAALLVLLTAGGLGAWCYRWYNLVKEKEDEEQHHHHIPDWDKTDRYYKCEGVIHGIARGGTWPVPYCLHQHYPSQWWVLLRHICGVYRWVLGGSGTGLLLTIGIALVVWRRKTSSSMKRDRCAINLDNLPLDST